MSYFRLLQTNKSLFFLWQGTLLSSLGDWFRHVTVVALVINLTGTGIEMAVVLVLEIIPLLFASPIAGVIIDKFDTRKLMIVADAARAILTLGFLTINSADKIWLAYGLTATISVIDIFFCTSRQVLFSRIVPQNKLISANSLFTLTSGFCLAGGSILAVYILAKYGRTASFLFDSSSFLVSGLLILNIKDYHKVSCGGGLGEIVLGFYGDLKDGIFYLRNNPNVFSLLLFNVFRFVGSGSMYVLLGVFGAKVFHAGDSGISAFYASFGIGIFLGGIVAKRISGKVSNLNYFPLIGWAVLIEGIFIIVFSQITIIFLSLAILTIAFLSRAIFLTFYNSLMMYLVADDFKGRIFTIDKMFSYIIMSLAMIACSYGLSILSPRLLALITGGSLFLNGAIWLIISGKRNFATSLPHFAYVENKR